MAVAPRSLYQPEHFMGRHLPRQRKPRHPMKATTTCNPSPSTATWPSIQPAPKATGHVPFTRHKKHNKGGLSNHSFSDSVIHLQTGIVSIEYPSTEAISL